MAGKSGTTSGADTGSSHKDAWMMAYNPDIVIGAWAGNTDAKGGGTTDVNGGGVTEAILYKGEE